jgi:hypothetical protein
MDADQAENATAMLAGGTTRQTTHLGLKMKQAPLTKGALMARKADFDRSTT